MSRRDTDSRQALRRRPAIRLPGDPSLARKVRYTLGFRLPDAHREWVRHDLMDAGWRGRMLARHLAVMAPTSLVLALLPGERWIRVLVVVLALVGSLFAVLISAIDIRLARLRQHRLPVPDDPERGRLAR